MRTQRDAGYVGHPVAGQQCDACTMFRAPDHCSLVAGEISPHGHCGYWEPKIVKSVAKSFDQLIKGEPSVGDVHVGTALGNQSPQRRRYKPFSAFVSGGPKKPQDGPSTFGPMPVITATTKRYATVADLPATVRGKLKGKKARQWLHVFNSVYDAHADLPKKDRESRAFAGAWSTVVKQLTMPTAPPFPYDPGFLSRLHGADVPNFLWGITHREELPKARVPLKSLVAIQDRIDPHRVAADEADPPTQRPTVARHHGVHYILDGHDRLAARVLEGKTYAKVRLHDMGHPIDPEAMKKTDWSTAFNIEKIDADKQQLFGWASTSTIKNKLVVDKQGDIIEPDELEKAAYDFVISSRRQGDMHTRSDGVGRLIESCVFTKEKQKALGIDLGKEAWWVGFQCDCKDLWKDVKSGRKLEFSIGGAAVSEKMVD